MARRSTYSAGAWGYSLPVFVLLSFGTRDFLSVYASGNPEEFAPIIPDEKSFAFVAIYFFDTINIIFCSAIRGGDTKFVMITTLVFVPFLTVFLWLGVSFHFGVYWCWTVLTGFISLMGTIFFLRFIGGTWMGMRLIDSKDVCQRTTGINLNEA